MRNALSRQAMEILRRNADDPDKADRELEKLLKPCGCGRMSGEEADRRIMDMIDGW